MDVEFVKHKCLDSYDGVITRRGFKIGVRHVQIVYMLVCSVVIGALRSANGIFILSVTDSTRLNDTYIQIHEWDRRIQGTVLSSFFFGYALMQVPAELMMKRVNCKLVLTVVLIMDGALSVAMPIIVNKGGWVAVCNAELLMGMTQACLSPANQALLAKWLPPDERSMFSCLVNGGIQVGVIIGFTVSGLLTEARLGWELVCYSEAMMSLSMAAVWGLLTANSPDQHQAVGDTEKEYIKEAMSTYRKRRLRKPWRRILKTPQFWAIASAHAASNAVFVFYLIDVPAYMKSFQISLKDSACLSAIPFISISTTYYLTAPSINWIYKIGFVNYIMNATYFRKLINALGAFGIVTGLSILSTLNPNSNHLAILILIATLGLLGLQFSGFLENHKDMSENFSGTLLIMSSSVASVVAAVVPLVTGFIIGDDMTDLRRWRVVLLSLASFYVLGNVVYLIFGSSERQSWDETKRNKFGYHNVVNVVSDDNQLELDELSHSNAVQQKYFLKNEEIL